VLTSSCVRMSRNTLGSRLRWKRGPVEAADP
jgi:hypothetical protein